MIPIQPVVIPASVSRPPRDDLPQAPVPLGLPPLSATVTAAESWMHFQRGAHGFLRPHSGSPGGGDSGLVVWGPPDDHRDRLLGGGAAPRRGRVPNDRHAVCRVARPGARAEIAFGEATISACIVEYAPAVRRGQVCFDRHLPGKTPANPGLPKRPGFGKDTLLPRLFPGKPSCYETTSGPVRFRCPVPGARPAHAAVRPAPCHSSGFPRPETAPP